MILDHMLLMAAQMVNSPLESTRVYWRRKIGLPAALVLSPKNIDLSRPIADLEREIA